MRPIRSLRQFKSWDDLAIAQFELARKRGGEFHLWGHSWEIDRNDDWQRLERVLSHIASSQGAVAVTNGELAAATRVLVTAPYYSPDVGGLERYAKAMVEGLADRGYDVSVLTTEPTAAEDSIARAVARVFRLPVHFKLSNTPVGLSWPWKVRSVVRLVAPDVVNAHAPVPALSDLAIRLAGHRRVILTYHSGSMKKRRRGTDSLISIYESTILRSSLHRADHIICSSDWVRDQFLREYAHKSTTITPGVDTDLFSPAEAGRNRDKVIFVGDARSELKGLSKLIEAISLLPGVELEVVGPRPVPEHPSEQVTYRGILTGRELVQALRDSAVLAMPSTSEAESFGMTIIEAQACSLPVVATAVGGVPRVVQDGVTGVLVPPGDAAALAAAIGRVLSDPSLARSLARNGRANVLANYLWDTRVEAFAELVEQQSRARSRTRALVVCAEYPPFVEGGLGVHYKELLDELRRFCDVTLVAARIEGRTPPWDDGGVGLAVRRVRISNRFPINHLMFNLSAWWLGQRQDVDIEHLCVPFGVFNRSRRTRPTVVKLHTLYSVQARGTRAFNPVWRTAEGMERWMIRGSALIMTNSDFMKDQLLGSGLPSRVPVVAIDNGVSAAHFEPSDLADNRRQLGWSMDERIVLNVGRWVPRKGTLSLVEAFAELAQQDPSVRLVLVGGAHTEGQDYADRIRAAIAAWDLANRVDMVEWLPMDAVSRYYKAADLYVHAAEFEPFGNVVLEAMAHGLPVVATRSGGPERILGADGGLLIAAGDRSQLLAAMRQVLAEPELRERLAKAGRVRASDFSWREAASATYEQYLSVLP